jgi:hypothetical protein
MNNIPALTVRQPWAWAISDGPKRTENRHWWVGYRGPLWLHAGARSRWDPDGEHSPLVHRAWMAHVRTRPQAHRSAELLRRDSGLITFGAVVALVTVTGCYHWTECQGRCSAWAARGSFHIGLAKRMIRLADPVPCRVALGLWHLPADIETAALGQLPRGEWSR